MAELLGIIAPIKKFLSNSDEDIFFSINGEKQIVCSLAKKEHIVFQIFREKLDGHVIM